MAKPNDRIHYLKRQNIDIRRWDACIEKASNRLVYAFHFYLDHMADGRWDALVLGDYEAVMPLPWRRKWGLRYIYQPAFTQQLGIFGPHLHPAAPGPQSLSDPFLQQLQLHFRFAEYYLNYQNPLPTTQFTPGLRTLSKPRVNYILPLITPYDELASNYKKDLVRNLRLSSTARLNYLHDFHLATVLNSFRRQYAQRLPYFRPEDYRNFERLCQLMHQRGQLLIRVATGPQQQLLATAILFRDANRLYLLQSTTLPDGRKKEANHFLLDQLIREWAASGLILDFEGSDQPGIAHFYANFGSRDQPYFFYRYNGLPWPVRLLKR
ncbi:MAG: GNAT family N-acetyltransferase [Bacteroidetes bacterium]|nr:GNAT family N-acetyltransferase [Bacteroidota bacterium]